MYTSFDSSREFETLRDRMMNSAGALEHVDVVIPTPSPVTRTIGSWTVGKPLGRGVHGRVFLGTSTKNEVVTFKIMGLTARNKPLIENEVQVNQVLTDLAKKKDDGSRILREMEVIRGADDDVTIHQPVVPMVLADLVGS